MKRTHENPSTICFQVLRSPAAKTNPDIVRADQYPVRPPTGDTGLRLFKLLLCILVELVVGHRVIDSVGNQLRFLTRIFWSPSHQHTGPVASSDPVSTRGFTNCSDSVARFES